MNNLKLISVNFFTAIVLLCTGSAVYGKPEVPRRIISLSPSLTEELYILKVEDRLIANTIYCKHPPDAEKKEKVCSGVKANLEKIIYLRPDLVLAKSYNNQKQIEKLRSMGIRVEVFPAVKIFSEICEEFIDIGKIVSKEKEAEEIVRELKDKVSSIQKSVKGLPKPKVLVQIGAKPLWIATKNSFINDFIELAGGVNIGPSGNNGLYSREKVLEQNPDVIIIVTMGIVGKQEKKNWQKYKTLNASKNNKIYIIDSYKACSPTPISFVEVLEEITGLIHVKAE